MENPSIFAMTVLGMLATPGPSNSLLATAGASFGLRRASTFIAAESLGYLCAVTILRFVLAPIMTGSTALMTAMRILIGAYLYWLAWKLWKRRTAVDDTPIISSRQVFITTLLNPKAIIFAFVVIPFGAHQLSYYLVAFSLITVLTGFAWAGAGAALGRAANSVDSSRLVPSVGAVAMGVFATFLELSPLLR